MRLLKWTTIVFVLLAGSLFSFASTARQIVHDPASCKDMARAIYLPVVNQHPESALKKLWVTSPLAVKLYFTAGCPWQLLMQANPGSVEYRPERIAELDSYLLLRYQAVQQMQLALGFLHGTGNPGDRSADEWAMYLPKFINALSILRDQSPENTQVLGEEASMPGRPDCGQVVPAFVNDLGLWMTKKDMVSTMNRARMRAWLASGCSMQELFRADDSLPGCGHVVARTEKRIVRFVALHQGVMLARDTLSRPVLEELAAMLAYRNMQRLEAMNTHRCVVNV